MVGAFGIGSRSYAGGLLKKGLILDEVDLFCDPMQMEAHLSAFASSHMLPTHVVVDPF